MHCYFVCWFLPNGRNDSTRDGFESRFCECGSNRVVKVRMRVKSSWALRMRVESENCELRIKLRVEFTCRAGWASGGQDSVSLSPSRLLRSRTSKKTHSRRRRVLLYPGGRITIARLSDYLKIRATPENSAETTGTPDAGNTVGQQCQKMTCLEKDPKYFPSFS